MNVVLARPEGEALSRRRQWLFAGLGTLLLAGIAGAAYFALRPGYQVLFRDLKPRDASAIVAELDKQKIPYRFDEHSDAILVPENDARAARVKLLSGDLKLSGVVGLELFNNSDLGLTDFAQKVNYQRALQGELARTIMTLDEIELARVHLTLPEASIFRREQASPKASVAVFVRDGEVLTAATSIGIQRLVAAAVPEMKPSDVTILDSRGTTSGEGVSADVDDPRFTLRRAVEDRLQRKVSDVLAAVPGQEHARVSVSADIDYDQSRITRETNSADMRPADAPAVVDAPATTVRSALPPLPAGGVAGSVTPPAASANHRTFEQIVGAPGTIRRLSVGVVLTGNTTNAERDTLRSLVTAAIGLDMKRGDVLTLVPFAAPAAKAAVASPVALPATTMHPAGLPVHADATTMPAWSFPALAVALLALAGSAMALFRRARPRSETPRLSGIDRETLASRLRLLLDEEARDHAQR